MTGTRERVSNIGDISEVNYTLGLAEMPIAEISSLVLLPLFLALAASIVVWRWVSRPWLFLVTSALALLGVQSLAAPSAAGFFLLSSALNIKSNVEFGYTLIVAAILQVILGIPFLWWLVRGLRKP